MPKLPEPIKPNATIGLICPAGGFENYKPINRVINYLAKLGYNVKLGNSVISFRSSENAYKYLSGNDKNRLLDLIKFWNDISVDAIFCLKGGYGSLRLLQSINFKLFQANNKILLGFSDITALLLALYAKTRNMTFHGPLLSKYFSTRSSLNNTSLNLMWSLLKDKNFRFSYSNKKNGVVINSGKTSGVLLGGNLSTICSLLGSKFLPSFKNSILFLEDCNEELYKLDRYLTQLDNAGIFNSVSGLIFSSFEKCNIPSNKALITLISDKIKKYQVPTIYRFPIGHGLLNYTVPIGAKVILDANNLILKSYYEGA